MLAFPVCSWRVEKGVIPPARLLRCGSRPLDCVNVSFVLWWLRERVCLPNPVRSCQHLLDTEPTGVYGDPVGFSPLRETYL